MKTKIVILLVLVAIFVAVALVAMNMRQQTASAPPTIEPSFERGKFVALYVDLEMAAEHIGIGTPQYEAKRDSILKAYGTTFEEVTTTLKSYDTQPEKWAEVWQAILAELEKRKGTLIGDSTAHE